MIKKESYYTNSGELVSGRITSFEGRFREKKGYAAYFNGKSIMTRQDAVYPTSLTDADLGKARKVIEALTRRTTICGTKAIKA